MAAAAAAAAALSRIVITSSLTPCDLDDPPEATPGPGPRPL